MALGHDDKGQEEHIGGFSNLFFHLDTILLKSSETKPINKKLLILTYTLQELTSQFDPFDTVKILTHPPNILLDKACRQS